MERLTTNKLVSEMGIVDLAYNCCFAKDGEAWYRDFEKELSLRDYIRWLYKTHLEIELPEDFEVFDNYILTDLECGEEYDMGFVIAFLYHMMWSKADLYERLKRYEDLEEKALLLKLPISIENAVDKLFSHNEIISLWREAKENGVSCHKRIWYGMAWNIPKELKSCKFVKIFGTIPESIAHADIINIEVVLSAEAEKALAEMEKGND